MQAIIKGVGVWGPGFANFDQFKHFISSGELSEESLSPPKPERIPSRERRRAPLMVKLAVEVAEQACQQAGVAPAELQCVFSSGIGDADTTDYMCRVLAGPDKLLSPTKFHNSVHNAAAGYWSISTQCEKPATFVGGMHNSFSMALLESMIQIVTTGVPVILVLSDLPVPKPMWDMHSINDVFGCAFVLLPVPEPRLSQLKRGLEGEAASSELNRVISFTTEPSDQSLASWPKIEVASLADLYTASPAAKALCLLQALLEEKPANLVMPVSQGLQASVSLSSDESLPAKMTSSGTDRTTAASETV